VLRARRRLDRRPRRASLRMTARFLLWFARQDERGMLRNEGQHRTDGQNRQLAGALALVAGFVNASGFLLVGTFTSHVTGNVGRMTRDLAVGNGHAALLAAAMITSFFLGAFVASMAIEANFFGRRDHVYGMLLLAEAALLLGFFAIARLLPSTDPHINDAQAAVLCAAMGMQNSLVTRLSGAIVRTTHLTGVVTDLGIEAARWFRYLRHQIGARSNLKLIVSPTPIALPHGPKAALLLTILGAFVVGGGAGAQITLRWPHLSLLIPAGGLILVGLLALRAASDIVDDDART
jgi:uncharacterized membrane protein YoaK (UPF0700 family)